MPTQLTKAADGRTIAIDSTGSPDGRAVFLLHGTPGSRIGPSPRPMVLHRLGIHLISIDRPGYGDSDRHPGRTVADFAEDVQSVADVLGIDRFAVVGRSGGAPHALACAALLPDRVTRVAALVSLAPSDAEGLDWYSGMADSNVSAYTSAEHGRQRLAATIQVRSRDIRADPSRLLADLRGELPDSDRRVVADPVLRRILELTYSEALRYGPNGWIDDALALRGDWGFDPGDIRVPVLLWHGEDDPFSPVEHSRWLADRIPGARMVIEPGAAHFGALQQLIPMIRWAAR